jgi:hypothetical protein
MAGKTTLVSASDHGEAYIIVCTLMMAYGSFVLMHGLNFTVEQGQIRHHNG